MSISALTSENCDQFLNKKISSSRQTLRPRNLAALRAHIDRNAPLMPKHAAAIQERDARMAIYAA